MNVKIFMLLCIIGLSFLLLTPAFTDPVINLWDGSTLNGGFTIEESNQIIFGFEYDPPEVEPELHPAEIDLILIDHNCNFEIEKDEGSCDINLPMGCSGSRVTVPTEDSGSLLVTYEYGLTTPSNFAVNITTEEGTAIDNWEVSPTMNANMQFARCMPDINVTVSPQHIVSGQIGVELNASGTTPVYFGTIDPEPEITSYSWNYIGSDPPGAVVILSDTTSAEPAFNAPVVDTRTDLVFELTVIDDVGLTEGLTATEQIIVTVGPPVDVIFLMDRSGSMSLHKLGLTVTEPFDGLLEGGCCSRLASAKAAAKYFIEQLGTFASDIRIGVAIFPGEDANGERFYPPAPDTDLTDTGDITLITDAIGGEDSDCDIDCSLPPASPGLPTGITPGGRTPTLDGLIAASVMLDQAPDSDDRSKIIVLLSDGIHNVGDTPEDNLDMLTNYEEIYIYTIGMGTSVDNANHASLQDISINSGIYDDSGGAPSAIGFLQYNMGDPEADTLATHFEKIMADMVSLDFTSDPYDTIGPGETNIHKVLVTNHDSIVGFTISWESSQTGLLDLNVITPKGERIGSQVSGNGYKKIVINREYLDDPANIGEWKMEVTTPAAGTSEVAYNYSVITKSSLNMKVMLDKTKYVTGDTMLLEARLIENNMRLRGATVKAKIKRPESGIGNWHFKNIVSQSQLEEVPDEIAGEPLSMVDKKNYILLQLQKVKLPEIITDPEITMNDEGKDGDKYPHDGIYTAQIDEFSVPGTYKFQIIASGMAKNNQKFERQREVQKFIDIIPDVKETKVEGDIEKKLDGGAGIIRVSVIPFDKAKNYLGPGYADDISITSSEGTTEGELEDLLYGAYHLKFRLDDIDIDPQIMITVRDVVVYDGLFSGITPPPYKWEISAHVGYSLLHSNLDDIFGGGISGIVDVGYRFTASWSVELLLGIHYFPQDDSGNSFYWLNSSINGKYSYPIGMFRIFTNGGVGLYIPESGDFAFGGNLGGGLAYAFNESLSTELDYNFHYVMAEQNNQFSVIQLGLRFGF